MGQLGLVKMQGITSPKAELECGEGDNTAQAGDKNFPSQNSSSALSKEK